MFRMIIIAPVPKYSAVIGARICRRVRLADCQTLMRNLDSARFHQIEQFFPHRRSLSGIVSIREIARSGSGKSIFKNARNPQRSSARTLFGIPRRLLCRASSPIRSRIFMNLRPAHIDSPATKIRTRPNDSAVRIGKKLLFIYRYYILTADRFRKEVRSPACAVSDVLRRDAEAADTAGCKAGRFRQLAKNSMMRMCNGPERAISPLELLGYRKRPEVGSSPQIAPRSLPANEDGSAPKISALAECTIQTSRLRGELRCA